MPGPGPRPSLFLLATALASVAGVRAGAQALYNNGASITIQSGAGIYVKGSLANAASSTITNNGLLNISGHTINNGTIASPAASTLVLQGTVAQTLSGTSPVNAGNLVVNNAAGVTLATPLTVHGAATFTSGLLHAANSSAPVVFSATGTVSGTPTDASHINGYVQKNGAGAFTFPVGDAARYQPVGVNLSANAGGMTARYYGSDAGSAPFGTGGSSAVSLLYYNKSEYWDLAPATTAAGTVTLYFDNYNNAGIGNTADLRVAHKSGGQWLNEGGTATGTTASGAVTSNNISTFSPFTLGSIATTSPLPVTLVSFSGTTIGSVNRLDWKTAVEDAGTTFTLERSADGHAFGRFGTIVGAGHNSVYSSADDHPLAIGYYRLRITEADGTVSFSRTVVLINADAEASQVSVYPRPANDCFFIRDNSGRLEGTAATVLDAQGRTLTSVLLRGETRVTTAGWVPGVYTLRLADGTAMKISKQ